LSIIRVEESKGGGRAGSRAIEMVIRALEHVNFEFLNDSEVVLV